MVPGAHASLTALGPAKGLDIRLVTSPYLDHVGAEMITTPSNNRLWAATLELRSRDTARLLPDVRLNVWQRPMPDAGFRLEAGVRRVIPRMGGRLEGLVHVGYKTEGYLADAPGRAGLLFSVSAATRYLSQGLFQAGRPGDHHCGARQKWPANRTYPSGRAR